MPAMGIAVNFCRNTRRGLHGAAPDPFARPRCTPAHLQGLLRGTVAGRKREEHCQCPACGTTSRFKSNRAVAKERERLWRRRQTDPAAPASRNAGSHGLAVSDHLDLYQRFGTTKGGDPRWRCKAGRKVFSVDFR
jgi:hypothetical protein